MRLVVPDARLDSIRSRLAEQVARLDKRAEAEALDWIETVSDYDDPQGNATR